MSEFGGLWKQQINPACTKSVRVFIMLKLDTTKKKKKKKSSSCWSWTLYERRRRRNSYHTFSAWWLSKMDVDNCTFEAQNSSLPTPSSVCRPLEADLTKTAGRNVAAFLRAQQLLMTMLGKSRYHVVCTVLPLVRSFPSLQECDSQ